MGMEESDYDYAEGSVEDAEARLAEIMADNVYHQTTITQLKSKIEKLELECKKYAMAIEEWQLCYSQQTEVIDSQANEIRKLKEDYDREMASADQLAEEADDRIRGLYEFIDSLKSQLQASELSRIDFKREVDYLQQFVNHDKL